MIKSKRGMNLFVILFTFVFATAFASACTLNAQLLNQDPYPAIPGEVVKVVFQVTGTEDPNCGDAFFRLHEEFPFQVDSGMTSFREVEAGTFVRDYSSVWMVPFRLIVHPNAVEGTNDLEVTLSRSSGTSSEILQTFEIEVEDVTTEFEVYVRDYSQSDGEITFELVNVGDNDVESLSVEIPSQENVDIRGSSVNTVGILDSNEYTTTTFNAIASEGEIDLIIRYNDITGTRRTIEQSTMFNPAPFTTSDEENGTGAGTMFIILILVAAFAYWFYRRHKRNQARKRLLHKR